MAAESKIPPAWRALTEQKWEQLEALEEGGRLLFPDSIRRRTKSGALEEVPVAVRPLRKDERRKARFAAEKYAADCGVDPENQRHKDLFEDIDTLSIIALAIREPSEPHSQHATIAELEHDYDMRSLDTLWSRYKLHEDRTDPREPLQTEEEFWAVLGAIAKARRIDPLADMPSHEQNAFILRTVELSLTSPAFRSFCSRFESSTPAA